MYKGGICFSIHKSFGNLQLIPETSGLRINFTPVLDGAECPEALGAVDMLLPIESIGGLWATTKAFLYGVESLDENVILDGDSLAGNFNSNSEEAEVLVKLYRDKPRGQMGKLTGDETCWLRIVTGRSEEERRRIKLGPRDLMCLELACAAVMQLAMHNGAHKPVRADEGFQPDSEVGESSPSAHEVSSSSCKNSGTGISVLKRTTSFARVGT